MRTAAHRVTRRNNVVAAGLAAGSYTLSPTTNRGYIVNNVFAGGTTLSDAYTAVRTNTTTSAIPTLSAFTSSGTFVVGQNAATNSVDGGFDANVWESFFEYDTQVQSGLSITNATLNLFIPVGGKLTGTNFNVSVALFDFGTAVTTADFIVGSSLSSSPVAAVGTSFMSANASTGLSFSSTAGLNSNGKSRIVVYSARTQVGTVPSDGVNEYIQLTPTSCTLSITVA